MNSKNPPESSIFTDSSTPFHFFCSLIEARLRARPPPKNKKISDVSWGGGGGKMTFFCSFSVTQFTCGIQKNKIKKKYLIVLFHIFLF